MNEEIRVRCEGSGHPPASATVRICSMCGAVPGETDGVVIEHTRRDVLAMIDRGDFDDDHDGAAMIARRVYDDRLGRGDTPWAAATAAARVLVHRHGVERADAVRIVAKLSGALLDPRRL